ncbi:putative fibroblast growth factor 1 isoform X2 [Vespula maculifrons]|nr:fibroblast growth factor 13-like isoform X1 [Vespula vulgaris]
MCVIGRRKDSDNRDKELRLGRSIMSLRWIHENLEAPTCDEECSDIDDSCSDDSYDTDLSFCKKDTATIEDEKKGLNGDSRKQKRETRKHQNTIVTFDENSQQSRYETSEIMYTLSPYVIWDPRQPAENPIYNSLVIKLYCRTGYHLAITSTGKVRGLPGTNETDALLHVTPVSFGVVRIQGVETQLYLAFNKKGYLYGESNMNKDNTEWEQWSVGSYDAFRSRKYVNFGWWIGIKKNGRAKSGPRTVWGQKAIQFLAIRQDQQD